MTDEQRSSQPPQGQFDPDYYVQWQPPVIPPGQGRRVVRIAIVFLSSVLVLIALIALWRSNLIALPGGRGDIVGRVAAPAGGAVVFTGTDLTEIRLQRMAVSSCVVCLQDGKYSTLRLPVRPGKLRLTCLIRERLMWV